MNLIITKLILQLVSGHPRAGGADTGDGLGGLRGLIEDVKPDIRVQRLGST